MEVCLGSASFSEGGEDYVLSCVMLIPSADRDEGCGKLWAEGGNEAVCMVRIRRRRKTPAAELCTN